MKPTNFLSENFFGDIQLDLKTSFAVTDGAVKILLLITFNDQPPSILLINFSRSSNCSIDK